VACSTRGWGRGFYNSYHAEHRLLRYPLDHVFHSNHFRLVDLQRLRSIGSTISRCSSS
jgi:endonuclease/exonuclease/phosphatase (EEP) superfamily protein YafD